MEQDIRWKQRFQNYCNALENFSEAIELLSKRNLSKLEKQGLVQSFEFTQELSWKVLKDFLEYKGAASQIIGSKDAIRNAYSVGLIKNGDIWMDMIASRNLSSHAYDEDSVQQIIDKCVLDYHKEFLNLKETLEKIYNGFWTDFKTRKNYK